MNLWGALWHSRNKIDGLQEHLIFDRVPVLFRSRKEALQFINEKYGYIKTRPDLRAEPHGWRMPRVVRVKITTCS